MGNCTLKNSLLTLMCAFACWGQLSFAQKPDFNWTVADLIQQAPRPFAIGHKGYGINLGEDAARPIENTTAAVRKAFRKGAYLVDIDVAVTADGVAVLLARDFLHDYTCVNSLTFTQLKQRLHHVPTLKQVLRVAKHYATSSEDISGLLNIQLNAPSPLCDPYDIGDRVLVHTALEAIAKTGTSAQVIIESNSPTILAQVATLNRTIARNLSLTAAQLLAPQHLTDATGLPYAALAKQAGFGLQWAEIGLFFRQPSYANLEQFSFTAYLTDATFITLDKPATNHIEQLTPAGTQLWLAELQKNGIQVITYTANTRTEWNRQAYLGADGIQSNDLPMAINQQKGVQHW